jgi:uncharacterized protein (DUF433 family)
MLECLAAGVSVDEMLSDFRELTAEGTMLALLLPLSVSADS